MTEELNNLYKELCSQLGSVEYQIDELKRKAKKIRKRMENLQWVHQSAEAAPKKVPVKIEESADGNG